MSRILSASASRSTVDMSLPVAPSAVPPSTSGGPPGARDRLHRRILAGDQQIGVVGVARRGAEPGELAWVEADIGIVADEPQERHVAGKGGDDCAVLGGGVVEVI